MAYVGADPELVEAAVEEKSGPVADDDKPAKAPKEKPAPKAKADKPEDTAEDTPKVKPESEKPETPEKSATSEPEKEDTEADKDEDKEDDAKVAKGLASVARAERDHLHKKQAFESQAARYVQQLESRDREIGTRESQLKERETRLSDVERAVQSAKSGDYDAIFSYLEQQGITAEAANAWLGKAPTTPEARAQSGEMQALRKQVESLLQRDTEREERQKREAKEYEQRAAQQKLVAIGTDEEKYPFLCAIYTPAQIYDRGLEELALLIAPQGLTLRDLGNYPDHEVLAAYERALESADTKARSNQKLKSLLGVVEAPQHNGNGTHASKPATARTLTNGMTSEKSRTSIVTDDEADAESLRLLEDMKRAQKAAQT